MAFFWVHCKQNRVWITVGISQVIRCLKDANNDHCQGHQHIVNNRNVHLTKHLRKQASTIEVRGQHMPRALPSSTASQSQMSVQRMHYGKGAYSAAACGLNKCLQTAKPLCDR